MDFFDHEKWEKQPAAAPEGMYDQVRQRIMQERIRIVQTHRQLLVGSALLLIVGAFNISIIFVKGAENYPVAKGYSEQLLYETYFNNAINLSNEK
jgi:hypothetical protein